MRYFEDIRLIITIILAILVFGCGETGETRAISPEGATESAPNEFKSRFLDLTVTKPADWYALTTTEQAALQEVGTDLLVSDNADLKRLAKASAKKTITLFNFFMHEPGSPVAINPAVMGLTENVSALPGIKSGADYFFFAKKLMTQSGLEYSFADSYKQRTIGGVVFDEMDVTIAFNGAEIHQAYYAARHGDYVVVFIESYGAPEYRDETSSVIDTIGFDW